MESASVAAAVLKCGTTQKMEITEWDPLSVPAQDLHHGEFGHQVHIDYTLSPGKNKEQYHTQMKPLKGIISAYINTCGGCVELQNAPNPTDLVQAEPFDKWRNNIAEQFNFVLPDSLRDNIRLEYNKGKPYVQVRPCANSSLLVSLDTHLYTRQNASKKYLGLQESVTKYMNQAKKAHKELQTKPVYSYEEKLPYGEDDHIEFKNFFSACSAEALLAIINGHDKSTVGLSLFAMANLMGGGTVFIGADDDGKVIGQPLSEAEEEEFREGMLKFYKEDVSGMKRYCDNQEFNPVDGRHFSINLIPVEGSAIPNFHCKKRCKECPNKRRVLIKISVFQSDGILLMRHPESYKVRDNGKIVRLSIDEWYKIHKEAKPPISHHQIAAKVRSSDSTAKSEGDSTTKASPSASRYPKDSRPHEKSAASYTRLSFKENSSMFSPQPAEKVTPESIAKAAEDNEIFKLRKPCNSYPPYDALLLRYPSIEAKLDIIKKEIGEKKSFALVESSIFSCISHDLEASDIPVGSPLKSTGMKPDHHLIDIFAVDETGAKNIICLFEGNGKYHDQEKSYGLQLVRILRKRLTEVLKKQEECRGSEVHIKLIILRMESDVRKVFQSSRQAIADDVEMKMMKNAIAYTFLAKESVFKNRMGKDITIQFSLQQAEALLTLGLVPITVITGGPGTGKSLLAQCVCEQFGKSESVYICSTRPLAQFVQYLGKAETFLLMGENLLAVIRDLLVTKSCIALDESHMIECKEKLWTEIFKEFVCSSKRCCLYIFRDSEFHDFQNKRANSQLNAAIIEYNKSNPTCPVFEKVLTEVFRNSQIIGSYLYAIQATPPSHLTFRSTMLGEDVTILAIPNLRIKSEKNGLLMHLRSKLKAKPIVTVDIAVLVDGATPKRVQKELELFLSIFRKYWPEIKVHCAGIFPPKGIILDSVHNFIGLDADVIIYIVPLDKDDIRSLKNIKYKTAVVSRAINQVEFLQDAVVKPKEAIKMKFDRPPTETEKGIKKQSPKQSSTSKQSKQSKSKAVDDLIVAAQAGDVNRVSALLKQGADINGESEGNTALGVAAVYGKLEIVKLLLSLGGDTERGMYKPLSQAAWQGHIDIIQCLLQHGADINGEDDRGYTALGLAAWSGELEMVKLLLSRGADTEGGRKKPLSQAAGYGHIDTVQCLLQHGASQEAKNHALTAALNPSSWLTDGEKANLKPIVEILKSHGAVADGEQKEEEEEPPSTSKVSSSTA